ncbi:Serine/threonine-protein kinase PknB [Caulifigura coniformis]|uniref:Serine/threonine-protein kinase PknB n=1 Tax=Caulifigura coniformis TaxID=2527983 RepID=A0A517SCV4_9PLAN|nr:serine/threonine-protein kinase [Caulifigura coniformis]QDT53953.1 Serine/threonine-protein kinase PknB [Caulifigura coniformis]
MSVLRNKPESETSGTAYTFLKPMPSLRPAQAEPAAPPTNRPDVGAMLFPARDAVRVPVAGVALGPYVIEEEIGRGGMGAVFRALDSRLDRIVALKVLGPDLSRDRSSFTRFQNEARAAARLDHESIARVHDVGHDHGLYYIAFEFVPGRNLREALADHGGSLSPDEAVGYTLQIADALRHTAAVDVVHRDIKPSNIILSPTGRAKLVDWGLARQNSVEVSQDLTQTGTTLGTFDYISPEQAVDPRSVDVRSDIYSLGCTLFHMLTGEPPYPRGSMFQKVVNHHRSEPPDASSRNSAVPPELSDVVRRMMAADPAARYATPDELVADLLSVTTEIGLRPTSPVSGVWSTSYGAPPRERIRAGWGWMGAFVALMVLVWSVDRSSRTTPPERLDPPAPAIVDSVPSETPLVAPAEPDPATTNRRPSGGIVRGVAEAPREFAIPRNAPAISAAPGGIDFSTLNPSDLVDSVKSFLQPGQPSTDTEPRRIEAPSQNFVLQSVNDRSTQRFSSLEAAILAAADDDVIELDFDGPSGEVVRPIRIGRRLTIRAAPRRRPQLDIGLTKDEAFWSSVPAPKIFTVAGGSLFMADVDLVLAVPGRTPARWSVFSLALGGRVSLRGVSVTIQNGNRQPVAVFDAVTRSAPAIGRAMTDVMADRPLEITVESSVVRGAADLIWQDSTDVVDVRIAQSALALNGALFRQSSGSSPSAMATSRGPNELLLEHVTAVLERSLALIELGDRETARPLQIDCRSSIVKITDASQPLISISGQGDVNDYIDSLSWNGRYNWFDVAGPAVDIATPGVAGPSLTTWKFDEWFSRWMARGASQVEQRTTGELFANGAAWEQPEFTRAEMADFTLDPSGQNSALKGAEDGGAAGIDLEQRTLPQSLPELPRSDSAARPTPRSRFAAELVPVRPAVDESRR